MRVVYDASQWNLHEGANGDTVFQVPAEDGSLPYQSQLELEVKSPDEMVVSFVDFDGQPHFMYRGNHFQFSGTVMAVGGFIITCEGSFLIRTSFREGWRESPDPTPVQITDLPSKEELERREVRQVVLKEIRREALARALDRDWETKCG